MADGPAACVCVLFYGDDAQHIRLARRVLNAPMQALGMLPNVEFRFGCNACGSATLDLVAAQVKKYFPAARVLTEACNTYKYPMMRQLFALAPLPPLTMWFDHDSYLDPALDVPRWFGRIQRQAAACDMLGSVYRGSLTVEQRQWVTRQTWCASPPAQGYTPYAVGSWWTVQSAAINQYDWPPRDLQQKSGDILLGELFRQRLLSLCHFRDGVCINNNDAGVEGAQPRTMV